jgi:hypothetical protein
MPEYESAHQRMFTTTSAVEGLKLIGGVGSGGDEPEIRARSKTFVSIVAASMLVCGSGWSCWYDSTKKVVRTAENSAACAHTSMSKAHPTVENSAYENEESVQSLHPPRAVCLVVCHCFV